MTNEVIKCEFFAQRVVWTWGHKLVLVSSQVHSVLFFVLYLFSRFICRRGWYLYCKTVVLRERQSPYRKSRGDNIYFALLNSGKAHHSRDDRCLHMTTLTHHSALLQFFLSRFYPHLPFFYVALSVNLPGWGFHIKQRIKCSTTHKDTKY